MSPLVPAEPLQGRYLIQSVLSDHADASVYLAQDLNEQASVVVKSLNLAKLRDWKQLELFEREASTLKNLSHPGVPRLFDYFRDESEQRLYLVVEHVPGQSLEQQLATGWRPRQEEVESIARQSLEILDYLHSHHPPVVHRDLKPSNLMIDVEGGIHLIDFGAVQHLRESEGRTVVGTFGYMAPEQFAGQAIPASDLYGLGATLVHLLSGRAPSEMPLDGLKLCFQPHVNCSPALQDWLAKLLNPEPTERFVSAAAAREALDHPENLSTDHSLTRPLPKTSRRPAWLAPVLALALLLGGVGVWQFWPDGGDKVSACLPSLIHRPAQSGPQADAFRQTFADRFKHPPDWEQIQVPNVSSLNELQQLWRCQPTRSGSDPVFFKTAWQLILHSPLDDNTVLTSISLMSAASEDYPQMTEMLAFAFDRYYHLVSPESWDRPAHGIAGIGLALGRRLNQLARYPEASSKVAKLIQERGADINDHQLQLLYHELAFALWKQGQAELAEVKLDEALQRTPQGNWKQKLEILKGTISQSQS
ncbi:MAG: hypothetical protein CVV27_18125 [Candidatus Melainabacteria bacterium HGW-Melainabacteria-1]|nr:MAG: hypothetical protein CVV27_18125 [Candidatus Melainabacteria bacterium HGW-Melainabacteria-1]